MRYFNAVFFVLLLVGCSKDKVENKEPEKCQLASITRLDHTYLLTYEGTKIVRVGNVPEHSTQLIYGATGKLVRVESPAENPQYRTELFYNSEGKVAMEKAYEKYMETWLENRVLFYTYTNGKVTGIKQTIQRAMPVLAFDHEIIWEGDNIGSIVIRSGATVVCTQQFSYDMTQKNPMIALIDLYHGDNIAPSYELPLYTSANRLIKEENSCPSAQTTNFTYEFNNKNSLLKIYTNGYELISYGYECR